MKDRRRDHRRERSLAIGNLERRRKDRRKQDRRRSVRIPINIWVEERRGKDEVYFHRVTNISIGGVFLEKRLHLPHGTKVSMEFQLPGHAEKIVLQGKVVSDVFETAGGIRPAGMGLKFASVPRRIRDLIDRFLSEEPTHADDDDQSVPPDQN